MKSPATPTTDESVRTALPKHGWEPSLAEMLEDPVVRAMMAVDGVHPADIVTLLSAAKERLGADRL